MRSRNRLTLTVTLGLALCLPAWMHADSARMTVDGTEFSFELVRSGGKMKTEMGSGVSTDKGEGYRVLFDSKLGRFYGYTVKAAPLDKGGFRLELGPLAPEVLQRLATRFTKIDVGRPLVGEELPIEYPAPQEVGEDEPLLLDLLVNPSTGEKLADVIRVRRAPRSRPKDDQLSVKQAAIRVNGKAINGTGSASGDLLYFWVQGHPRFVVSRAPVAGHDFLPATLSEDRKTLRFEFGGASYEWEAREPFRIGETAVPGLWVMADPGYRHVGSWGIGTLSKEDLPR